MRKALIKIEDAKNLLDEAFRDNTIEAEEYFTSIEEVRVWESEVRANGASVTHDEEEDYENFI